MLLCNMVKEINCIAQKNFKRELGELEIYIVLFVVDKRGTIEKKSQLIGTKLEDNTAYFMSARVNTQWTM